ncbi:MAG: alpha/beta hydrolase [Clostridia bacterium]|nr:alpha/beta hydrolase [Clostridia bacterium]
MNCTETKVPTGDTYLNEIRFGKGSKHLLIISGVTLCGLEGQGKAVAKQYQAMADDYTVWLVERRRILPAGFSVEDMADDIAHAMDALQLPPMPVYGVSQGGMIAQSLAIRHPERVTALVLCATMCRVTDTLRETARRWLDLAHQHDVVQLNRSFFRDVYSPAFLDGVRDLLPTLEQQGTAADCERFAILMEACLRFDVSHALDDLRCPVLVIGDKNDRVIGPEGSLELQKRLHCPMHLYDCYSHAVYDEAPDLQQRLMQFLG